MYLLVHVLDSDFYEAYGYKMLLLNIYKVLISLMLTGLCWATMNGAITVWVPFVKVESGEFIFWPRVKKLSSEMEKVAGDDINVFYFWRSINIIKL